MFAISACCCLNEKIRLTCWGQEPGEEFLKLCLIFPGNQLEFWKLLVAKALHGPGDCDDQEFSRSLEKFLRAFLERSYGHPYSILPLKKWNNLGASLIIITVSQCFPAI
jgi:hypothetical protein